MNASGRLEGQSRGCRSAGRADRTGLTPIRPRSPPARGLRTKARGPNLVLAAPHPLGDDPDRVLADGSEEAQSLTPTESNPTGTRVRYLAEFR
jgi:hypothetical protein